MNRALISVLVALTLTACGSAGTSSTSTAPAPVTVTATAAPEPAAVPDQIVLITYTTFAQDMAGLLGTFSDYASAGDAENASQVMVLIGNMAQTGLELTPLGVPEIDTAWDLGMEDMKTACAIGVPAIDSMDSAGMAEATAYMDKATAHFDDVNTLLQEYAS